MDLLKLRPVDSSAASIRRALSDAETAQATTAKELARAKTERDNLLLDGSPQALAVSEKKLTTAAEKAERVAAMAGQLAARLAVAEHAEALAIVEAAKAEAEAHGKALSAWWNEAAPR